jgi:hypothetical protein
MLIAMGLDPVRALWESDAPLRNPPPRTECSFAGTFHCKHVYSIGRTDAAGQ